VVADPGSVVVPQEEHQVGIEVSPSGDNLVVRPGLPVVIPQDVDPARIEELRQVEAAVLHFHDLPVLDLEVLGPVVDDLQLRSVDLAVQPGRRAEKTFLPQDEVDRIGNRRGADFIVEGGKWQKVRRLARVLTHRVHESAHLNRSVRLELAAPFVLRVGTPQEEAHRSHDSDQQHKTDDDRNRKQDPALAGHNAPLCMVSVTSNISTDHQFCQ